MPPHLYHTVIPRTQCLQAFYSSFQAAEKSHFYKILIIEVQARAAAKRKRPLNKRPVWSSNSSIHTNEYFPKMPELECSSSRND